jgi:hypothetical protein
MVVNGRTVTTSRTTGATTTRTIDGFIVVTAGTIDIAVITTS